MRSGSLWQKRALFYGPRGFGPSFPRFLAGKGLIQPDPPLLSALRRTRPGVMQSESPNSRTLSPSSATRRFATWGYAEQKSEFPYTRAPFCHGPSFNGALAPANVRAFRPERLAQTQNRRPIWGRSENGPKWAFEMDRSRATHFHYDPKRDDDPKWTRAREECNGGRSAESRR